jgi:hypothetical protein
MMNKTMMMRAAYSKLCQAPRMTTLGLSALCYSLTLHPLQALESGNTTPSLQQKGYLFVADKLYDDHAAATDLEKLNATNGEELYQQLRGRSGKVYSYCESPQLSSIADGLLLSLGGSALPMTYRLSDELLVTSYRLHYVYDAQGELTALELLGGRQEDQLHARSEFYADASTAAIGYYPSTKMIAAAPDSLKEALEIFTATADMLHTMKVEQVVAIRGERGKPGIAGATGPRGPKGATGAPGFSTKGATGASGTTGATGSTGSTGNIGATGDLGPQGETGPNGSTGLIGAVGTTGVTGAQGPTGIAGATGPDGIAGGDGATGPEGATGTTGNAGATGNPGMTGITGTTGATGQIGAAGATGATGIAGITGATGPSGATGASGSTGAGIYKTNYITSYCSLAQYPSTTGFTPLIFNHTPLINGWTHSDSTDNEQFVCQHAGRYCVFVNYNVFSDYGTPVPITFRTTLNSGSGYVEIPGSSLYVIHPSFSPNFPVSQSFMVDCTVGAILRVEMNATSTTTWLGVTPNFTTSASIVIVRLG